MAKYTAKDVENWRNNSNNSNNANNADNTASPTRRNAYTANDVVNYMANLTAKKSFSAQGFADFKRNTDTFSGSQDTSATDTIPNYRFDKVPTLSNLGIKPDIPDTNTDNASNIQPAISYRFDKAPTLNDLGIKPNSLLEQNTDSSNEGNTNKSWLETAKNVFTKAIPQGVAQGIQGFNANIMKDIGLNNDILSNPVVHTAMKINPITSGAAAFKDIVDAGLKKFTGNDLGGNIKRAQDYYANKEQEANQKYSNLGGTEKFIGEATANVANMIPSMLLSIVSGGESSAAKIINPIEDMAKVGLGINKGELTNFGQKLKDMIPFMASAAGSYARDAEKNGATTSQQLQHGLVSGLAEGVTELLPFGYMTKALGIGEDFAKPVVKKGAKELFKSFGETGLNYLEHLGSNIAQEVAVNPITNFSEKMTYNKDMPLVGDNGVFSIKQSADSAVGAIGMEIVLMALGLPTRTASHVMAKKMVSEGNMSQSDLSNLQQTVQEDVKANPKILDETLSTPEDYSAYSQELAHNNVVQTQVNNQEEIPPYMPEVNQQQNAPVKSQETATANLNNTEGNNTQAESKVQNEVASSSHEFNYDPSVENMNNKTWYHGSGTEGLTADKLTPGNTKIEGLYGHGVYLTDDPSIASKYAKARSKRTNTPLVYEANIKMNNAIDLEKPLPKEAYDTIRKEVDSFDNSFGNGTAAKVLDNAFNQGKSGKEIWEMATNELANISNDAMVPQSELYEYFQNITGNLKDIGYDGFTHIGGNKTGGKKHQVAILFDPNNEYGGVSKESNIRKFTPTNFKSPVTDSMVQPTINTDNTSENIKLGEAIWKNKDADQPIVITGYAGEMNGKKYVNIEGSNSAIPLDEIQYTNNIPEIKTNVMNSNTQKEVSSAFKGAQPGELDYKPINVGMQTQIVTEIPKGQTPPFQYAEPELEKVHQQNKGIKTETLAQKVKEGFNELRDMFTRPIRTLPVEGNEQLYYGRNGLINLTKAREKAGDETTRMIADITKGFKKDKNAFDMFSRKVFLDDMAQEAKLGNALPNMWTPETVTSELQRLDEVMPQSVKDAIAKRNAYWNDVKSKYISAMKDVGVNMEDRLTREDYFRHQVLDYMDMKNAVSGAGKKLKVPSNRGFTKGRSGEYTGNINTDYIQAEYEVMAQMLHDTEIANTIKMIDRTKNIVDKVKADAKEQGIDDWHKAIPEGYTVWQPREGNLFYMYKPVSKQVVEGALNLRGMDLQSIKDPKIKGLLEDIINDLASQKEVLALGGKRKEYVIKQEVADTLDNMTKNRPTSIPAKFFQNAHTMWKRWILYLNPRNFVKYGTRNAVGDLDAVIAGNPSGITKTLQSMTELADAMRNGKFTPELKSFYDLGGYQATQAAQEISQVNNLKPFEEFKDNQTIRDKVAKPFNKYEEITSDANAYREMVLRYGSFLDYLGQLNKGELKNYGASKKSIIDALETNEEKAYKLSNDLLGAYDDVSDAGKFLRRQFIPFYSWLETNFKRYKQLFANSVTDNDMGQAAKTAAGLGIKTSLSVIRKMGGIFALTAVLAAWNSLKYKDLEDTLPEDVKSKPHVILGKDKDGNTIYFSRLGSLNDFLEWFGLDNAWQDGMDILNGKKTVVEQLTDMIKTPINKVATGVRPEIKTTVEYLTGKKFYPDIFKGTNIRDKNQYLAQSLGLGNEYNQIFGKPHKSYESTLADIFMYKSNPEEAAYWSALDTKSKYQKKQGKSSEGFMSSDKSNALYNYKLALRYGDKEAQDKYMKLYESYGGNPQQTIESVLTMSPYYGIPKEEINNYKASLNEKDKNTLNLAEDYFVNLLGSELNSKNPASEGTKAMIDIYRKTYETKQFPKVIGDKVTVRGKDYKLTPNEITELQSQANEEMYKKADEIARTEDFKKKTPDIQSRMLSDALNRVVSAERNKFIQKKFSK